VKLDDDDDGEAFILFFLAFITDRQLAWAIVSDLKLMFVSGRTPSTTFRQDLGKFVFFN
jgi:hypothetical protein